MVEHVMPRLHLEPCRHSWLRTERQTSPATTTTVFPLSLLMAEFKLAASLKGHEDDVGRSDLSLDVPQPLT